VGEEREGAVPDSMEEAFSQGEKKLWDNGPILEKGVREKRGGHFLSRPEKEPARSLRWGKKHRSKGKGASFPFSSVGSRKKRGRKSPHAFGRKAREKGEKRGPAKDQFFLVTTQMEEKRGRSSYPNKRRRLFTNKKQRKNRQGQGGKNPGGAANTLRKGKPNKKKPFFHGKAARKGPPFLPRERGNCKKPCARRSGRKGGGTRVRLGPGEKKLKGERGRKIAPKTTPSLSRKRKSLKEERGEKPVITSKMGKKSEGVGFEVGGKKKRPYEEKKGRREKNQH